MLTIRDNCDACGGPLDDVFSMGSMPLANGLLTAERLTQPGESFPLMVAECRRCTLAQLRYVVDPLELYRDYRFFTGASSPNAEYFETLSSWISRRTTGRRVLEIGSNDGTLLAAFEQHGFTVTGVDPAVEQCGQARLKLHHGDVHCQFWSSTTAEQFQRQFDVVVACNVLGHSNDLNDFLAGVRRVLRPSGLFVVEVQHLTALLDQAAFELIYHEHVSYFDANSLGDLLIRNGFTVLGWETTAAQCGTLRMWATLSGGGLTPAPCRHDWRTFRSRVESRRDHVLATIDQLQVEGRRICFYGAPAKATQLANFWRLGPDTIAFATDTTPAKQGCWIPGAIIPIVPRSHLEPTNAALVAAWNFFDQIVENEADWIESGGKLINPSLAGQHALHEYNDCHSL